MVTLAKSSVIFTITLNSFFFPLRVWDIESNEKFRTSGKKASGSTRKVQLTTLINLCCAKIGVPCWQKNAFKAVLWALYRKYSIVNGWYGWCNRLPRLLHNLPYLLRFISIFHWKKFLMKVLQIHCGMQGMFRSH